MKCLIAEDDKVARKLLETHLSGFGDCSLAINGSEALEAFTKGLDEDQPYDLICLDIMMPKMDGREALKVIRDIEQKRNIPESDCVKVIMTTALNDFNHIANAFRIGCESYLVKPIRKDELLEEMVSLGLLN